MTENNLMRLRTKQIEITSDCSFFRPKFNEMFYLLVCNRKIASRTNVVMLFYWCIGNLHSSYASVCLCCVYFLWTFLLMLHSAFECCLLAVFFRYFPANCPIELSNSAVWMYCDAYICVSLTIRYDVYRLCDFEPLNHIGKWYPLAALSTF